MHGGEGGGSAVEDRGYPRLGGKSSLCAEFQGFPGRQDFQPWNQDSPSHLGLTADGFLSPGHTHSLFPSPLMEQAHPAAELLQREENTPKIS